MDKRFFHTFLNELKDNNPEQFQLLENVQETFEHTIKPISDSEIRALKLFPVQFIVRIPLDNGEWTTQLHIWAENGVPELLEVDPLILTAKNSYGDSILMSLIYAATGAYTEVVNYDLIKKILNTDFSYQEKDPHEDALIDKNAIDETNADGQNIIDYLIDFAFAKGKYQGQQEDIELQQILNDFANKLDTTNDNIHENESSENQENPSEITNNIN